MLLSAFGEGDYIHPVKFEIKQKSDAENALYAVVSMTKMEKTSVMGSTPNDTEVSVSPLPVAGSTYSIAEIVQNVNPKDRHFLKYLPDQMLDQKQIEAKKTALAEDQAKIEALEDRIRDLSADIKAIAFSTGKRDMEKYNRLIDQNRRNR